MPNNVLKHLKLTNSEAEELVRKATGIDLPYEVLSTDEWVANRLTADKYRERRIFPAGDACHLHSPMEGYGMNMGIADGVGLGGKLVATLQGWVEVVCWTAMNPNDGRFITSSWMKPVRFTRGCALCLDSTGPACGMARRFWPDDGQGIMQRVTAAGPVL